MLIKIETYFDGEYWCARGIGADIFTQGESLDDLMRNIKEAVSLHYEEQLNRNETITKWNNISKNELVSRLHNF
jgi:predicted RNase H-like HicB family nuclease